MATTRNDDADIQRDDNRDLITGEFGSHPIGTGVGATVGGAAVGAAAGMVAGPVGTIVGTIAGGIAGGLVGKDVAEHFDPSVEDHHWRNEYPMRSYYDPTVGYEEVGPAYRYGWESRSEYGDKKWDEVEPDLARDWTARRGDSKLDWGRARPATRDAWERVESQFGRSEQDVTQPNPMKDRGTPLLRTPK